MKSVAALQAAETLDRRVRFERARLQAAPQVQRNQRRLYRLRKKSDVVRVLKGRGFKPRRKCHKISGGFSR
jgi:hypothetical protein